MNTMNFQQSLEILDIEKYSDRIWNSNSNGELFHLHQYFVLAEHLGKTEWFSKWFDSVVKMAEEKWKRPESVFQYIFDLLIKML